MKKARTDVEPPAVELTEVEESHDLDLHAEILHNDLSLEREIVHMETNPKESVHTEIVHAAIVHTEAVSYNPSSPNLPDEDDITIMDDGQRVFSENRKKDNLSIQAERLAPEDNISIEDIE